jgi:hypothetical protein
MRSPLLIAALALGAAAVSAGSAAASWPFDPTVNLPVCTAPGSQSASAIVSDGAGGAIITWADHRVSGSRTEIYAQRIARNGTPAWAANGVLVIANAGVFTTPVITTDGAGGAIIAWSTAPSGTSLVFAQHLDGSGARMWDTTGVRMSSANGAQSSPVIASDGAGGAFVVWADFRVTVTNEIFAQRVNGSGIVQWGTGVSVCSAPNAQGDYVITPDGFGGFFAAWYDLRGFDADIYTQRISAAGAPAWTVDGVAVCTQVNDQRHPVIVPDGFGGALLAWQDERTTLNFPDIYAQHVNFSGGRVWSSPTFDGRPLAQFQGSQALPVGVSDGLGGMIVVWQTDHNAPTSHDIFGERIDGAGVRQWSTGSSGHLLIEDPGDQLAPRIVSDGAGGAILAYRDDRSGSPDISAYHLLPSGQLDGTPYVQHVCTAAGTQDEVALAEDGRGGAVLSWTDARSGANDIYAERFDHTSALGDPTPVITSVRDLPGDNGGQVLVNWNSSDHDVPGSFTVAGYNVWRSVPWQNPATRALALRRGTTSDPCEAAATGRLLVGVFGYADYAWERAAFEGSHLGATHSVAVPTAQDSVAGSNPYTIFMVQAYGNYLVESWPSEPDSGYSMDNLAPAVPFAFTGAYAPGSTHLSWLTNLEPDFAHYNLYRGTASTFVPGPASLIASKPDTGYVDVTATAFFYKLAAVDVHGNISNAALVSPPGVTGVVDGAHAEWRLASPAPNPANGETILRFTLPGAMAARLTLYDAAGRHVRTLIDQRLGAGNHQASLRWGRGEGLPLPSGVYMVRLETPARVLTQRLTVIQ